MLKSLSPREKRLLSLSEKHPALLCHLSLMLKALKAETLQQQHVKLYFYIMLAPGEYSHFSYCREKGGKTREEREIMKESERERRAR